MRVNERAYMALVDVCETIEWPERNHRDLYYHDCGVLGCYPVKYWWELPEGMPFGWILRDLGTNLVPANALLHNNSMKYYCEEVDNQQAWVDHTRNNIILYNMAEGLIRTGGLSNLYFWWDGQTLMRVPSPHTIIDRMRAYQDENGSDS